MSVQLKEDAVTGFQRESGRKHVLRYGRRGVQAGKPLWIVLRFVLPSYKA